MTITAQVIADSISPQGHRLTTMQLRYPKFIHGEFMTHRVFSRNASSSRAIPTEKYLEEVRSEELRATPVFWGKNQKGMQAVEEMGPIEMKMARSLWAAAACEVADIAQTMAECGFHKQIVNRVLEPFVHINVVVTATEYDNFFGLRLDKGAQPEMRFLAGAMFHARKSWVPRKLKPDQWHLPYVSDIDVEACGNDMKSVIKVSVARCARVSYTSFDTGKISTIDEDVKLYDRLMGAQPIHASPAEHQATPDNLNYGNGPFGWDNPNEHGNFTGWRQYRKMLPGEALAPLPEEYRS